MTTTRETRAANVTAMRSAWDAGRRDGARARPGTPPAHKYPDRDLQSAYASGWRGAQDRQPSRPSEHGAAPGTGRHRRGGSSKGSAKRSSSNRRRSVIGTGAKATRQGARDLIAPSARSSFSGMRFVGLTLAVIVLYDALLGADALAGFLRGPAKALEWVSRPEDRKSVV